MGVNRGRPRTQGRLPRRPKTTRNPKEEGPQVVEDAAEEGLSSKRGANGAE